MLDIVLEESMSPRTRTRMDNLVCCNLSGLPGGGLFRDKVIEIIVRQVKTKLRNLHMSLNNQVLDKSISSLTTISKIVEHDVKSMCSGDLGLQSSYDYIHDDAKEYMREKISDINPFGSKRPRVTLLDKSMGLSPFTGMTKERLEQFAKRNKKNYKRNHPAKTVLSTCPEISTRSQEQFGGDCNMENMEEMEDREDDMSAGSEDVHQMREVTDSDWCSRYGFDSDATGRDRSSQDGTGKEGAARDRAVKDGENSDRPVRDGLGRDGLGRHGTGRDGAGRDGSF